MATTKVYLLVEEEYNEAILVEATSLKDCIQRYAHYTGEDSDLFNKALIGVEAPEDLIGMFNHFAYKGIIAITEVIGDIYGEVGKLIYVDGDD